MKNKIVPYLMPGSADDGGEDGPGRVVSGEARLAHSGTIVHYQSSNITFISHSFFYQDGKLWEQAVDEAKAGTRSGWDNRGNRQWMGYQLEHAVDGRDQAVDGVTAGTGSGWGNRGNRQWTGYQLQHAVDGRKQAVDAVTSGNRSGWGNSETRQRMGLQRKQAMDAVTSGTGSGWGKIGTRQRMRYITFILTIGQCGRKY
ncbi:hypothetical protein MAR_036999 [Mya arenaria]|uniref:Uncharacterized protein n=1 Tax=Mya arenaria TaxID=6604 RepID=A0ABY7FMA9_MYAAR|nr:hypothetical protein MAR_036999 [Mya arenaria]